MEWFNFCKGIVDQHHKNEVNRETHAFVDDSEVFGRENDKLNIVDMLISSSSQEILTVVPIVGMGGLGKTTLAQLVFKDASVVAHFGKTMWICVSHDFDVKRIVKEILESVIGGKCDISNMTDIGCKLRENLSATRFLLVLDDVWNEDPGKWEILSPLLSIGALGSKIIVTTRKDKVADITGTVPSHRLTDLSENEGWSIFQRRAFVSGGAKETPYLVKIGKGLVKKCGGVPLAIKSLGGLMHSKKKEQDWLSVLNSEIWNLSEIENGILPVLKLSYDNFPSQLKQCFVYCSVFPRDHEIDKNMLIQLWMAENLPQPQMDDIGNNYFYYLLLNSFFQDVEKNEYGEITKCKMHDVVHDLARSIAGPEVSIMECGSMIEGIPATHHLSMIFVDMETYRPSEALYTLKKLRTFLVFGKNHVIDSNFVTHIPQKISNLKMLRVLDLSERGIEELPSSFAKLIHLRYLDLSANPIKMLSKSVTKLYNLQTLRLLQCSKLEGLPTEMIRMINLRHLEVDYWVQDWRLIPKGFGQLSNLKTITAFSVVNNTSGSSSIGGELGCLGQLGGELSLYHPQKVRNGINSRKANLKDKSNLCKLELRWSNDGDTESQEDVLEGLQPHPALKYLEISGFEGANFPSWMNGLHSQQQFDHNISSSSRGGVGYLSLSLKVLKIKSCHNILSLEHKLSSLTSLEKLEMFNCGKLASLGGKGLTALEELSIKECPELTSLSDEESIQDLISLKTLTIVICPKLESLSNGIQHLKALQKLYIDTCSNLMTLSEGLENLTGLQILTISSCPNLMYVPGLGNLTALQELAISSCPSLMSLPESLGNLTALQELTISECPSLMSLPESLGNPTALQELTISECPSLMSLPESLGNLIALQELSIIGCNI